MVKNYNFFGCKGNPIPLNLRTYNFLITILHFNKYFKKASASRLILNSKIVEKHIIFVIFDSQQRCINWKYYFSLFILFREVYLYFLPFSTPTDCSNGNFCFIWKPKLYYYQTKNCNFMEREVSRGVIY